MKAGYMHHISPAEGEAIRDSNFNKLEPGHLFDTGRQGKVYLVASKDEPDKVCVVELSQRNCINMIHLRHQAVRKMRFARSKMSTINILNRA